MTPRPTLRAPQGFTLVEISIVLGVFAIVMAGIWLIVSVVLENTRQYQANRELQQIVQNVRQLGQRITTFTESTGSDITTTLDAQGAFPLEMRTNQAAATGNLNHPWSSSGSSVKALVEGPATFGIRFTNIPKKACTTLATKLSSGELLGLSGLQINNGTVYNLSNLPLTVITAAGACTSSNTNTLEWRFDLRG